MFGTCPACKEVSLFAGLIRCYDTCPNCGTKLGSLDIGDGAIFLSITFVGIFVTILALWAEIAYQPTLLTHALLWVPLIMVLSLLSLRIGKAATIALILRTDPRT